MPQSFDVTQTKTSSYSWELKGGMVESPFDDKQDII